MKIDITPTKKLATDTAINCALDVYQKPLYCFEREDGSQHTATFDPQSISEFQPSRTVSEMIAIWEQNSSCGKLNLVEYVYNMELKVFPLRGELIPVVAKRDIEFLGIKKGDKLDVQSILYDKETKLVNAIGIPVNKKDTSKKYMLCSWPGEDSDPVGTIIQHPKNEDIEYHKAFDAVIAPIGSYKSMIIVTKNASFPSELLGGDITKYFQKI